MVKKKIKDLSSKEVQAICSKSVYCKNCPIHDYLPTGRCGNVEYLSQIEGEIEIDE